MTNEKETHSKQFLTKRNSILFIGGGLVVFVLILVAFLLIQPERSVANFCQVAKQQKAVLTTDVSYDKRLDAYKMLEAVAPDDIRSDITTIRKGYESIVQNPSNTISAGMGMSGAENRRTDYITKSCTDF